MARESVPAINIRHVASPWGDERTRGEWRNERGALVAVAEMISLEGHSLEFSTEWVEAAGLQRMRTLVSVIDRPGRKGNSVRDTRCPKCLVRTHTLYFFERVWHCAACHDLVALTKTITAEQDLNRRYWAKHRKVRTTKPFQRSTKTLDKDERALARLHEQLTKRGAEPRHLDLPPMVHLRWLRPDEAVGDPDDPDKPETLQPLSFLERSKPLPLVAPWSGDWVGHG